MSLNTYTIRYTTVLGEHREENHQAKTRESAVASFTAHQMYRDDAAAADLSLPIVAYFNWALPQNAFPMVRSGVGMGGAD